MNKKKFEEEKKEIKEKKMDRAKQLMEETEKDLGLSKRDFNRLTEKESDVHELPPETAGVRIKLEPMSPEEVEAEKEKEAEGEKEGGKGEGDGRWERGRKEGGYKEKGEYAKGREGDVHGKQTDVDVEGKEKRKTEQVGKWSPERPGREKDKGVHAQGRDGSDMGRQDAVSDPEAAEKTRAMGTYERARRKMRAERARREEKEREDKKKVDETSGRKGSGRIRSGWASKRRREANQRAGRFNRSEKGKEYKRQWKSKEGDSQTSRYESLFRELSSIEEKIMIPADANYDDTTAKMDKKAADYSGWTDTAKFAYDVTMKVERILSKTKALVIERKKDSKLKGDKAEGFMKEIGRLAERVSRAVKNGSKERPIPRVLVRRYVKEMNGILSKCNQEGVFDRPQS